MLIRPRGNDQVQAISENFESLSIEIMDRKHGIVIYCMGNRVVFKSDGTVEIGKV